MSLLLLHMHARACRKNVTALFIIASCMAEARDIKMTNPTDLDRTTRRKPGYPVVSRVRPYRRAPMHTQAKERVFGAPLAFAFQAACSTRRSRPCLQNIVPALTKSTHGDGLVFQRSVAKQPVMTTLGAGVHLGNTSIPSTGVARTQHAGHTFRRHVYQFLTNSSTGSPLLQILALYYQGFNFLLIVALFAVDGYATSSVRYVVTLIATVIFSVEYALRVYSCVEAPDRSDSIGTARLRAMARPGLLLEAVSLVSLLLDVSMTSDNFRGLVALRMRGLAKLRILGRLRIGGLAKLRVLGRFLRFSTVFRVERNFMFFRNFFKVISRKRFELGATFGICLVLLLTASVSMYYIESSVNAQYSSIPVAMWWATTALTTVGYGDIAPVTSAGRLLGSICAFMGVALFGLPAGIIASGFQELLNNQAQDVCPACNSIRLPDSIFCRKCGKKRENICGYCNNIFAADAVFCRKCGKKIEVSTSPLLKSSSTVECQSINNASCTDAEALAGDLEHRLSMMQSNVQKKLDSVQAEVSSLREMQQDLFKLLHQSIAMMNETGLEEKG